MLAVSAYWDRSIRVLHAFESIPFLFAGFLALRQSAFGYALGVAGGLFWLWMAGFLTTFVRNGFDRLSMLIDTGTVDRLDVLIAAPAAIATGGLAIFSLVGYARLPTKSWRDVATWIVALVGVPAFFVLIFFAFAPQYLQMLRRALT